MIFEQKKSLACLFKIFFDKFDHDKKNYLNYIHFNENLKFFS